MNNDWKRSTQHFGDGTARFGLTVVAATGLPTWTNPKVRDPSGVLVYFPSNVPTLSPSTLPDAAGVRAIASATARP